MCVDELFVGDKFDALVNFHIALHNIPKSTYVTTFFMIDSLIDRSRELMLMHFGFN